MTSVREVTFELLRAYGLTTIFGNPGSTELPMLADFPADFRYVLGLQEGAAVGMADGFAQATGRPTLVNLHSAPGIASAMGALVNAAAGRVPLVVTAGQQIRAMLTGQALLTNPDPVTLPRPLVKWSFEPPRPQDVPAALARAALLAAQPPRGPVLVSLPMDDWAAPADVGAGRLLATRTVAAFGGVDPEVVRTLADRLAAARAPVLLVGAGVDGDEAWSGAVALAERCRLPVYWAPLEPRCGFPTAHPAFQGVLPATEAGVGKALQGYDLIFVAGASVFRYYPHVAGRPLPEDAELVLLTADPEEAARAPLGEAIVGDVGATLRRLAEAVSGAPKRPVPPVGPRPRAVELTGHPTAAAVYAVIARALPSDGIVVCESVSNLRDCQDQIRSSRSGSFYSPAGASLGFGVPAAIGVQLARPDRPVVAVVGDGALQYTIPALWSAVRYEVPVTVVVLRNDRYGVLEDYCEFLGVSNVPGLRVPGIDTVLLASGYGVRASRVGSLAELDAELRENFSNRGPRLLEVPIGLTGTRHW